MDNLIDAFFNADALRQSWPYLVHGLVLTLGLSIAIVPASMVCGLLIAALFSLRLRPLNAALIVYIDFFRSFPPLVLIIFIFFGMPFLGVRLSELPAFTLGAVLNGSAFFGEIFRAGIESVPKGQYEAARSTGLTLVQAMRYVVLPQAIRNVLPPLTSNAIELVKSTSLASVVAIPELLRNARIAQGATFSPTPLVAAALVYLVILWPAVRLVSRMDRKILVSR